MLMDQRVVSTSKTSSSMVLEGVATFLVAEEGVVKGKCALGPFLSILVIECQHKCLSVNLCKVVAKVQIKSKGMFLDVVHCFLD